MAENRDLTIILRLKDQVSKNLQGLESQVKKLEPTFKKMAIAGTAAFASIGAFGGLAVRQAAMAEGAYNKFNTVFGKSSDDMLAFIKELRKTMPSATSDIVKMAADLQDLLVPLGLSRDKATDLSKGFLEVSNKIAAFNDVEPTEVLEAMKSALAGSSEPLRRFGVNALETSLETRALQEGLLKVGQSFKDLDPNVKNQIRAQALLAQVIDNSSDAINGFAENNDSFIRRQQNLQATLKETQETIGGPLLKTIDDLLKKMQPVVNKVSDWIEKNPELTEKILLASAAIAGLVAVVGVLGLVLPTIIAGFVLLAGPVGIIITSIGILALVIKNIITIFTTFRDHSDEVWSGIKIIFKEAVDWIIDKTLGRLMSWIDKVKSALDKLRSAASSIGSTVSGVIGGIGSKALSILPGRASGGPVTSGQPYIVGEQGPELFVPRNSGNIIPNGAGVGGGMTVNVTVNGDVSGRELVDKVKDGIMQSLRMNTKLAL